ncbi:MAG: YerC/YecD family TrpR-related protein [Candidatus Pacebacteria bacterium]|nr:YerC/YecD family TrpR-related protein [Candidatus Paceibacterota bacterium]
MTKWDNPTTENLWEAILKLKSLGEAKNFFRDLLTEQEIIEFGKRWQVAQMLSQKTPYSQIEKKTGLSSTTVARISKWLNKGMGGYRLMLRRLAHHHNSIPTGRGLR